MILLAKEITVFIAILVLMVESDCNENTQAWQINWTNHENVAILSRYARNFPLSTILNTTLDLIVIPNGENLPTKECPEEKDYDGDKNNYIATTISKRKLAVLFLGVRPNGQRPEPFILSTVRRCNPVVILCYVKQVVAGFGILDTAAGDFVINSNGDVKDGIIPVIEISSLGQHPTWTSGGNERTEGCGELPQTNDTIWISLNSLEFIQSNMWENEFDKKRLVYFLFFWACLSGGSLAHVLVRIWNAHLDKIPMVIYPLSLHSTMPLSLFTILLGNIIRFAYAILSIMSYSYALPSSTAALFGFLGVPWSLVTFVLVSSAWLQILKKPLRTTSSTLRHNQVGGVVLSGLILLLSLVLGLLNILELNLVIGGFLILYYSIYTIGQFILAVGLFILIRQLFNNFKVAEQDLSESTRLKSIKRRKKFVLQGFTLLFSSILVTISLIFQMIPSLSGNPTLFLTGITLLTISLSFLSFVQVEIFSYRADKHHNLMDKTFSRNNIPRKFRQNDGVNSDSKQNSSKENNEEDLGSPLPSPSPLSDHCKEINN
jgi:hypothetical protein